VAGWFALGLTLSLKVLSGNIVSFLAGKKAAHGAVLPSDTTGPDMENVRTLR
jgi:hypothetical protein